MANQWSEIFILCQYFFFLKFYGLAIWVWGLHLGPGCFRYAVPGLCLISTRQLEGAAFAGTELKLVHRLTYAFLLYA